MALEPAGFRPRFLGSPKVNFDVSDLKLNQSQIFDLATCSFIEERVNVLIVGPTGVGKSQLSEAIAHKACLMGYDVGTHSFHKLLGSLKAARADGSHERKLQGLLRPDLLVLDDFGLKPFGTCQAF